MPASNVTRVLSSIESEAYVGPYTSVGASTNTSDIKSNFGDGYIDELQIINGTALYRDGVTFTPPAKEL